jgi:predicted AAA+ superfamily ATPase
MTEIKRDAGDLIRKKMVKGKVIILLGARRVGKTFLLKQIINSLTEDYILLNGEDINTHLKLENRTLENYRQLLGSKKILLIDEAQKIPDIGIKLKLMIDGIDGLTIIATGSSAFDLNNIAGEPLTGRKYSYTIFPLSENEYRQLEDKISYPDHLKQRLIFGNYPEMTAIPDLDDKKEYLNEIINSYLLKDVMIFELVKNSAKVYNLLRLIAHQVGMEVSYTEIGSQLGMNKITVEKYLDLLSKVFILFKLEGYSGNLRKEVTKSPKWYFYDNGIRNAVIMNLNPIETRNDIGQLWENYVISERIKYQSYNRIYAKNYFWRTYDKQEIDLIEERDGNLYAYEIKWKELKVKIPAAWAKAYPDSEFKVINQFNFDKWV